MQLTDEGVAQLFTQFGGNKKIIGCVGELQFEVIQYRLLHEYGASVQFNNLPFYKACWITSNDPKKLEDFTRFKQANIAEDKDGHLGLPGTKRMVLKYRKDRIIRILNFILQVRYIKKRCKFYVTRLLVYTRQASGLAIFNAYSPIFAIQIFTCI